MRSAVERNGNDLNGLNVGWRGGDAHLLEGRVLDQLAEEVRRVHLTQCISFN